MLFFAEHIHIIREDVICVQNKSVPILGEPNTVFPTADIIKAGPAVIQHLSITSAFSGKITLFFTASSSNFAPIGYPPTRDNINNENS